MDFINIIHILEHCLISNNLFCWVYTKKIAFLEAKEIRFEAVKHNKIVDCGLLLPIEILCTAANLHKIELVHNVSECVVEESEQ